MFANFLLIDIDECATELYECNVNQVCKNTEGSYNCPCKPNYFLNGTKCESKTYNNFQTILEEIPHYSHFILCRSS